MLASPAVTERLRTSFAPLDSPVGDDVLAATVFSHEAGTLTQHPGGAIANVQDPRCMRIGLADLTGAGLAEVWRGNGPVRFGTAGSIRYVENGDYLAGWLDLDEARYSGLVETTEAAYAALLGFHASSAYPHVWRIWNYISAINDGAGDEERYRLFCVGRARALAAVPAAGPGIGYPAATAVGNPSGARILRLSWIAAREPGLAIESPRQLSAYHYPRRYGPASPSFSRAMLAPGGLLLVSGTASIVGHETRHEGDPVSQLHETLDNLHALIERACATGSFRNTRLGADSLLRVYLRHHEDRMAVEQVLRTRVGSSVPTLILGADICRSGLLVEIEAVHRLER
ncbi:MAG: pteridine-dependent deoxygenase [Gammaproteobacteria bacterium]